MALKASRITNNRLLVDLQHPQYMQQSCRPVTEGIIRAWEHRFSTSHLLREEILMDTLKAWVYHCWNPLWHPLTFWYDKKHGRWAEKASWYQEGSGFSSHFCLKHVCSRYEGDTPNFSHGKYGLLTLEEVAICWLSLVSPHRDCVMPTETLCPGPYCFSEGGTPLRLDMLRVYSFTVDPMMDLLFSPRAFVGFSE